MRKLNKASLRLAALRCAPLRSALTRKLLAAVEVSELETAFVSISGQIGGDECMKKFIAWCQIEVFADTEEEARKQAHEVLGKASTREVSIVEMKPMTERCVSCQSTYPPDEIAEINGEQICGFCAWDKYGPDELSPEDIPF